MRGFYQVANGDFRSGLNGQVEGGQLGCVLNPGVDVSLDANEEQHAFDVRILHRHVEEVAALVVDLCGPRDWSQRRRKPFTLFTGEVQQNLFSRAGFPLDDGLRRLVVLVRHGAGEGGHSLTVPDVETNVRVGNEQLYDDAVLVADGNVDGRSTLGILGEDKQKRFKEAHIWIHRGGLSDPGTASGTGERDTQVRS